jgi:hypothetical protein
VGAEENGGGVDVVHVAQVLLMMMLLMIMLLMMLLLMLMLLLLELMKMLFMKMMMNVIIVMIIMMHHSALLPVPLQHDEKQRTSYNANNTHNHQPLPLARRHAAAKSPLHHAAWRALWQQQETLQRRATGCDESERRWMKTLERGTTRESPRKASAPPRAAGCGAARCDAREMDGAKMT